MASSIQTKMIACCALMYLVSVTSAAPGSVSTPAPGCDTKSAPSAATTAPAAAPTAAPAAAPATAPVEPAPAAPATEPAEHPAAEAPASVPVYKSVAGGSATGSHPDVFTYTENEPKSSSAVGYASAAEGSVVAYSKSG